MIEKKKQTLIDYMVKHCGFTKKNARRRFEKWESKQIDERVVKKKKRKLLGGQKMTKEQIVTMVIYMYKKKFNNWWISESLGILNYEVNNIIKEYKESL